MLQSPAVMYLDKLIVFPYTPVPPISDDDPFSLICRLDEDEATERQLHASLKTNTDNKQCIIQ